MKIKNFLVLFFISSVIVFSQDLKGRWVELLHEDAINGHAEMIIQDQRDNGKVYGYGFDVTVPRASKNHAGKYIESGRCSYSLVGKYEAGKKILDITDVDEYYNIGHAPGRAILEYYEEGGKQYLRGRIQNRPEDEYVYGAGDVYVYVKYVKVPDDYEVEGPNAEYYKFGPPNPDNYQENYYGQKVAPGQVYNDDDFFFPDYEEKKRRFEERISSGKDVHTTQNKRDANSYFEEEELEEITSGEPIASNIPKPAETTDKVNTGYFPDNELKKPTKEEGTITYNKPPQDNKPTTEEPVEVQEIEEIAKVEPPKPAEIVKPVEEAKPVETVKPVEVVEVPEPTTEEPVEIQEIEEIAQEKPKVEEKEEEKELEPNYPQDELTEEEKAEIESKYASRNNKTIANIRTQDKVMKVVVKDYGEQDGDEISIIVDGRVLYRRLRITTVQKVLEIILASDKKSNEIVFVAENLGRVPPNTARIELFLNGKKYSYSLLTDTKTNAKIVLLRD